MCSLPFGYSYDIEMLKHDCPYDSTMAENPNRMKLIYERLMEDGLLDNSIKVDARPATDSELMLNHPADLLRDLENLKTNDECEEFCSKPAGKVAVVDIDIHPGNGTYYSLRDDDRFHFTSFHAYHHGSFWPFSTEFDYNTKGKDLRLPHLTLPKRISAPLRETIWNNLIHHRNRFECIQKTLDKLQAQQMDLGLPMYVPAQQLDLGKGKARAVRTRKWFPELSSEQIELNSRKIREYIENNKYIYIYI
uniref:Hist_deacetyl domain-containing protein n=1 Tax=Heterorhabditis bacteriophora TaxID=37862 RepID=A0A1I7XQA8_HETBA